MEGTCPSSDRSSSSVWQSVPRSKAGRSNVPIPEAAHGEGSQPQRLGQEAKSLSTSGAIGGHQSHGSYRVSLNPLRDQA